MAVACIKHAPVEKSWHSLNRMLVGQAHVAGQPQTDVCIAQHSQTTLIT